MVVNGSGYILIGVGCWWVLLDIFRLVVGSGGYILAGGGGGRW